MSSRSDWFRGISPEADIFIKNNEAVKTCKGCGRQEGDREIIGHCNGFDTYTLIRYRFIDGSTAESFLQKIEWDDGPVIYLGLRLKDGEMLW